MTAIFLLMALAAEPAASDPASAPAAYQQRLPGDSAIDWLAGRLMVMGRVRIVHYIEASEVKARLTTLKAEGDGREKLLQLVKQMRLDATSTFGDDPERVRTARVKLGSVRSTSQSTNHAGWMTVMMSVPVWGEGGVMGWFLEAGEPATDAWDAEVPPTLPVVAADGAQVTPATGDENGRDAPTGLVVDATHLTGDAALAPALLPRIVDENGRVLHGVETVGPAAARMTGLMAYAINAPSGSPDSSEPSKPAPRLGANPLRVKAAEAGGPSRTDVVVSTADGDRIQQAALHGSFLRECRVVVLMPPPPKPKVDVVVPRRPGTRSDPTSPGNIP